MACAAKEVDKMPVFGMKAWRKAFLLPSSFTRILLLTLFHAAFPLSLQDRYVTDRWDTAAARRRRSNVLVMHAHHTHRDTKSLTKLHFVPDEKNCCLVSILC
jgi:hypothetical protein